MSIPDFLRAKQRSISFRWWQWTVSDYPLLRARAAGSIAQLLSILFTSEKGSEQPRLTVKVLCQVRDDADIIEDWILWHGHLFGLGNLYVIADRPTHATESILSRYSTLITIVQAPLGAWPPGLTWCDYKTYNLNRAAERLKEGADFLIPLDADEFIIFEDKPDKERVLKELWRLACLKKSAFKFGQEYKSCRLEDARRPAAEIMSFRNARISFHEKKSFAKPPKLSWFGAGQHYVHTLPREVPLVTRLSLLHFRWRGISHMYQKCVDHLNQEIDLPNGNSKLPRLGTHVHQGVKSIESGTFRAWASRELGKPTNIIHGLAEYLSSTPQRMPLVDDSLPSRRADSA